MNANDLIEALEDAGYEPRDYSGRGMFGKRCVAVKIDRDGDLFALGASLAGTGCGKPTTDSLGLGMIAYWPRVEWPNDRDGA